MARPNNRVIFDMSRDIMPGWYWFWWNDRPKPKLEDWLYTRPIDPSRKLDGWTTNSGIETWHDFPLPEITIRFLDEFNKQVRREHGR